MALDSSYDYVTLTASGGDQGLAEACRLWWLTESVVFAPVGASVPFYVNETESITASFFGTTTNTQSGGVPIIPRERVNLASFPYYYPNMFIGSTEDLYDGDAFQSGSSYFIVAYVDSHWRLYYKISLYASFSYDEYTSAFLGMSNPSTSGEPYSTFSLFGYTLKYTVWAGYNNLEGSFDLGVASSGLTATANFYTLV